MIKFGPIQYIAHSVSFEPKYVALLATFLVFLYFSQISFDIVRIVIP